MSDSLFTTRPEIVGTFGVVASSHWVASQVGMAVLEGGGNAFDAAVGAAFVLHVVEPHMNGIGGDAVILIEPAADTTPTVVCGQGVAPAAATIDALRQLGHRAVPATGLAAAVVPGAFDAWMLVLRDHGTLELADALGPGHRLRRAGAPVCARPCPRPSPLAGPVSPESGRRRPRCTCRTEKCPSPASCSPSAGWPPRCSASSPKPARRHRERPASTGPVLLFAQGFVAEAIDGFCRAEGGLLSGQDLADWTATYESPLVGPLRRLGGVQGRAVDPGTGRPADAALARWRGAERWTAAAAATSISWWRRSSWPSPTERRGTATRCSSRFPSTTCSPSPTPPSAGRLIGHHASARARARAGRADAKPRLPSFEVGPTGAGGVEPIAQQVAASGPRHGDTCHLDVIDRWGNVVAATPVGRMAAGLAGHRFPRLPTRHPGPDVLAAGRSGRRRCAPVPGLARRSPRRWPTAPKASGWLSDHRAATARSNGHSSSSCGW